MSNSCLNLWFFFNFSLLAILVSWFSPGWKEIHDVFSRFFLLFNSVTSAVTAYMSLLSFYECECECGKVYIGETGRPIRDRIKKHDQDIRLARTEASTVSEYTHNTGPLWNELNIDRDPYYHTRKVKESIHIRLHPDNINRDSRIEIPEAWMPTIKKHNKKRAVRQPTAEGENHWMKQRTSKCTNQSWWKTTNHSRATCFISRSRMISRPHRLKKTSSMQSKRRDLHHTWPHRETNEKLSLYCYSPRWITTTLFLRKWLCYLDKCPKEDKN